MINFLIDKKLFSRRLEYTVRSIAGMLGYPYQIISNLNMVRTSDLTISFIPESMLDNISSRIQINIFNSEQIYDLDNAEREINLIEQEGHSIPVLGIQIKKDKLSGWKEDKSGIFYKQKKSATWLVPIDVLLNVFYHLSRYEEKWRHFTEETATDHSTSILSRHQELKVPVVDVLVSYLDIIIRNRIRIDKMIAVKILPWPGGEEMGVALTHDVDITRGVGIKTRIINTGREYFHNILGKKESSIKEKEEIKEQNENAWNLPELITFYNTVGWKATFFFISKLFEGRHIRYNISSRKFINIFNQLKTNEHEIALHPSKFAFDKPKSYRDEKEKLESVSGLKIEGMRQHYLRAKFPRLWILAERAAFSYDASLGYNYQAGFRAGTSYPFKTYDVFEDVPLSLTEFSLQLFEYNLPEHGEDITRSKESISNILHQVLKYGGLFTCLLHPSNYQRQPYNELWDFILKELTKRRIFVSTLSGHLKWLRFRERVKMKILSGRSQKPQLEIVMPQNGGQIGVELIGDVEPISSKSVTIKNIQKSFFLILQQRGIATIPLKKKDRQ
jgi:hypothetical protein